MIGMAGSIEHDRRVLAVAARRSGVCTRADLLEAGLSDRVIDRRMATGMLQRVGRGVYVVGPLADARTPLHRAVTLVPTSILSDQTAGHDFHRYPLDMTDHNRFVHVTVAAASNRRLEGIILHRRRRLPSPCDVECIDGLPVTGAARTIVDLSSTIGPARLRHVVQTAIRDESTTVDELVACFESVARRGVSGIDRLRQILSAMVDGPPISASVLETLVAELLVDQEISGFRAQFRPPWYDGHRGIVDFANPELRLVLEADGRRWHQRDQEMTSDRKRDRLSIANGWATIRVTWAEITQRPTATADDIRAVADARAGLTAA